MFITFFMFLASFALSVSWLPLIPVKLEPRLMLPQLLLLKEILHYFGLNIKESCNDMPWVQGYISASKIVAWSDIPDLLIRYQSDIPVSTNPSNPWKPLESLFYPEPQKSLENTKIVLKF